MENNEFVLYQIRKWKKESVGIDITAYLCFCVDEGGSPF